LWFPVNKVIHHNDIVFRIIIGPWRCVAGCYTNPRDHRLVKHDTEERKTGITRRGRNETTENQLRVFIEILDQRAGATRVSTPPERADPIWFVNICEDRTEATDGGRKSTVETGHEEQSFGDVAADWGEQA
jgi:hypothetical protein